MKKLRTQILTALKTPMTQSELITALRTDYGVKVTLSKMVSEGLIKQTFDFKYETIH